VAERLNAPVSKTGLGFQSNGGSNPPLSVPSAAGHEHVAKLTLGPGRAGVDHQEIRKTGGLMVRDLLLALVITVVAVALGITVHPLLFLLIVFAVLLLFMRRATW
jgi:hypothetical protein